MFLVKPELFLVNDINTKYFLNKYEFSLNSDKSVSQSHRLKQIFGFDSRMFLTRYVTRQVEFFKRFRNEAQGLTFLLDESERTGRDLVLAV